MSFFRPVEHSHFEPSISNAQSMTQSTKPAVHANLCHADLHIHHTRLLMVFLHPMTSYGVLLAACLALAADPDFQHMHQDLHACIEQA